MRFAKSVAAGAVTLVLAWQAAAFGQSAAPLPAGGAGGGSASTMAVAPQGALPAGKAAGMAAALHQISTSGVLLVSGAGSMAAAAVALAFAGNGGAVNGPVNQQSVPAATTGTSA